MGAVVQIVPPLLSGPFQPLPWGSMKKMLPAGGGLLESDSLGRGSGSLVASTGTDESPRPGTRWALTSWSMTLNSTLPDWDPDGVESQKYIHYSISDYIYIVYKILHSGEAPILPRSPTR